MSRALTRELEEKAWALIEEVEAHGGMTKAVAEGLPKHRIEEAAAARAAKVDTGETVIVGVNRYRLAEEEEHDILEVDNAKVRARPDRADGEGAGGTGRGESAGGRWMRWSSRRARAMANLLALIASKQRAPAARSAKFPMRWSARSGATGRCPSRCAGFTARRGATAAGKPRRKARNAVADRLGRKPRIMVAKMGQDGHDRGANLVSSAFTDLGFEVIPGPLFQTPRETAEMAVEHDVDVVGASSLAAGHRTLIPEMIEALKDMGRADIKVVAGGVIPPQDYAALRAAGVQAIFGPGTNLADAADEVLRLLGHNRPPLDEAAE